MTPSLQFREGLQQTQACIAGLLGMELSAVDVAVANYAGDGHIAVLGRQSLA